MKARTSEPTLGSAYRHSVSDLFVLAGAAFFMFLYFWPPLGQAARSGQVVKIFESKPQTYLRDPVKISSPRVRSSSMKRSAAGER
jgi:hypothetical protein